MILQNLNSYYERLKADPKMDIPLSGFGTQKFYAALLLDEQGRLKKVLPLADKSESKSKKNIPRTLIVPQEMEERSGTKLAPHFLWDNTMYALGNDNKGKPKRSLDAFEAFKDFHCKLCHETDDEGIRAFLRFLDLWEPKTGPELEGWEDIAGMNIVFATRIHGKLRYVHESNEAKRIWMDYLGRGSDSEKAVCLVSGKTSPIARIHPAIKGVQGAQAKGAAIVSFNKDAFCSYKKTQSYNAPVSRDAAFAYTTALNYLLRPDSRQKIRIGDTTTIWWTDAGSDMEKMIGGLFGDDAKEGIWTNNTYGIKSIREFLEEFRKGKKLPQVELKKKFFILGLSPNNSRLSVRFWHVGTVRDFIEKMDQHFQDLSIEKRFESDPDYPSIWRLLLETAVLRKAENVSSVLAGSLTRSVITGARYPESLLSLLITRIRADQTVNYLRAGMIKACLLRKARIGKTSNSNMEVKMGLDDRTDIGYRLGRLFAVLEKIQIEAHKPGKINATIKDRYYGSASANPRSVFALLIRLAQNHLKKVRATNDGKDWGLDGKIGTIIDEVIDFPANLTLEEQGLFAIGYYHQRQDFFTKSAGKKEEIENEQSD